MKVQYGAVPEDGTTTFGQLAPGDVYLLVAQDGPARQTDDPLRELRLKTDVYPGGEANSVRLVDGATYVHESGRKVVRARAVVVLAADPRAGE